MLIFLSTWEAVLSVSRGTEQIFLRFKESDLFTAKRLNEVWLVAINVGLTQVILMRSIHLIHLSILYEHHLYHHPVCLQ